MTSFGDCFLRYVINGNDETEGYFLLMVYFLHLSECLTTKEYEMLKGHYESWTWNGEEEEEGEEVTKMDGKLKEMYEKYELDRFGTDFISTDVKVLNILNQLLGDKIEGEWYWEQDQYNLLTMMVNMMVDEPRKMFDSYTKEIAEGREYQHYFVGVGEQPFYNQGLRWFNAALVPFEKFYKRIRVKA